MPAAAGAPFRVDDQARIGHCHARAAIDVHARGDRAMQVDGAVDERYQLGQHALRLAQRIAVENGGLAARRAVVAPLHDVARHVGGAGPAVYRQAEGRFRDEGVARHDLERRTGGVRLALVVARHDPHLAIDFDAHLRGSQHVARGVQRDARAAQREGLAVRMDAIVLVPQPPPQDRQALDAGVIAAHACAGMVAMAVREDRDIHGAPGIDVEPARGAIQAFRTQLDDVGHDCLPIWRARLARGARAAALHLSVIPRTRRRRRYILYCTVSR
ncbi:hypothetical protein QGN06_14235 [Achromobacter xylosoxidans]